MKKLLLIAVFLIINYLLLPSNSFAQTPCPNSVPGAANLFQIDVTSTTAKLSFTPPNSTVTSYNVFYGFSSGDQKFTVSFPYGTSNTVVTYTISSLTPSTTYYFSVQAVNGCATGPLSNWKSAITLSSDNQASPSGQLTTTPVVKLPQTGSASSLFPAFVIVSLLVILGSLILS